MIRFYAKKRRAACDSNDKLTTGSVGIPVEFTFDGWDGIVSKIAVFRAGEVTVDVLLTGDACTVPPEVLVTPGETLTIGVYGTDAEGTVVIPTVYADAGQIRRGAEPSGVEPTPQTQTLLDQLLAAAQAAQTAADAAETIAQSVRNDADSGAFDGAPGAPGTPGKDGAPGAAGASAYEIAVAHGYTGTEAEWLESLQGEPGDLTALLENVTGELTWVNGNVTNSGAVSYAGTRLVPSVPVAVCDCQAPSNTRLRIAVYDAYYAFLGFYSNGASTFVEQASAEDILAAYPKAMYLRPVFMRHPESSLTPADLANYDLVIKQPRYLSALQKRDLRDGILYSGKLQQGGYGSTGLEDGGNSLRLRSPCYLPVQSGETYRVTVKMRDGVTKTPTLSVSYYAAADYATPRLSYTSFEPVTDGVKEYTVPANVSYLRLLMGYVGNAAISAEDVEQIEVTHVQSGAEACDGYVIGPDLLRRPLRMERLGTLSQLQAFCKYQGKYYSTNGSSITEQDADFKVLRTAAVNVGHGNSLQLGRNGKAYASGWDDNKIYVVDLVTLSVESVINLPTSGYTTGVVDEERGLVYIFQRDSYPTTEAQHQFIVYDYRGGSIVSTGQTIAFAALQSCDLYHDRIIAVNGGGTADMPNGYRVFDLSGHVIASYILPAFDTLEPEGVCLDRDTGDLLLSYSTQELHRITAVHTSTALYESLDGYATQQWVWQQGYLTQHQSLAAYRTSQAQDEIDRQQNTAIEAKYTKPGTGIPKTDMAEDVQTSLGRADTALQQHQDISGKLDKEQGIAHAGEFVVVGSDGNITTQAMTAWQGGSY